MAAPKETAVELAKCKKKVGDILHTLISRACTGDITS